MRYTGQDNVTCGTSVKVRGGGILRYYPFAAFMASGFHPVLPPRFFEIDDIMPENTSQGPKMNSLAAELKLYGVEFDTDQFNNLLTELRVAMAPTMSIEDFVCHLDDAKQFCNAVRSRVGGPLPDWVICRRLLNLRKRQGKKGKK